MKRFAVVWAAFCAASVLFGDFTGHKISLNHPEGYYRIGETAVCTVTLGKDGKPLRGLGARCTIYWEGKEVERHDFMTTGEPVKFKYKSDVPGWVYFRFEVKDRNGNIQRGKGVMNRSGKPTTVTEAGALFSSYRIRTKVKRPADALGQELERTFYDPSRGCYDVGGGAASAYEHVQAIMLANGLVPAEKRGGILRAMGSGNLREIGLNALNYLVDGLMKTGPDGRKLLTGRLRKPLEPMALSGATSLW